MLAFLWWQQKCSREAAEVAGVRSLSCRSGGDQFWALKSCFQAGESRVCPGVGEVPTGPGHPSRTRRENSPHLPGTLSQVPGDLLSLETGKGEHGK